MEYSIAAAVAATAATLSIPPDFSGARHYAQHLVGERLVRSSDPGRLQWQQLLIIYMKVADRWLSFRDVRSGLQAG